MKSTFKKQRRGSKKNKSRRHHKTRRHYFKRGGKGRFFTGRYKGITKLCSGNPGLKDENCLYIVPKILEKGITGKGMWNSNTWDNVSKAVDNNLNGKMEVYSELIEMQDLSKNPASNVVGEIPDDEDVGQNNYPMDTSLGGKKKYRKRK